MTRKTRAAQSGFTLIEIIVVVVIIGLLAAVVTQTLSGRTDDARIAKARQDIQAMETALTLFKLDNFRYPTTEQGLRALVEKTCRSGNPQLEGRRVRKATEQGPLGPGLSL